MLPPPDFVDERAKWIGKLPPAPAGAVALDASQLQPLVQGDADFQLEHDSPAPGMTTARIGREGRPGAVSLVRRLRGDSLRVVGMERVGLR
jgi:hypothetical protein